MNRSTVAAALVTLTLASAMLSFTLVSRTLRQRQAVFLPARRRQVTLVIDPGHGGEDGGAVSLSGIPESRINLSISLKCDQIAGLFGLSCVTLRQEDVSLASEDAVTLREKKRSDLERRVSLVEQTEGAWLLSIHQNKFDSPASHGAQVFYRPDPSAQAWAAATQEGLRMCLDADNHRKCKEIPEEIYLMKHVSCPGILVECGFLSNPEEERLLQDEGYQRRIAAVLMGSFLSVTQHTGEVTQQR
jgi:N-acetylmuramoyl-L-alanine amidase